MTWTKVDDSFADHPKVMALGRDRIVGVGLWTAAACYCARHLTDGFVPSAVAEGFGHGRVWGRLVEVGLVDRISGGYQLHDWLEYNPPRDKVLRERQEAKDRMQRKRSGEVPPNSERTSDEVRDVFADPVPVPSRPVPGDVFQYIDPASLYREKVGRRPGRKELAWLEDLHARYSRSELVRCMQSVEAGPDYLKRLDAYIEGRAA